MLLQVHRQNNESTDKQALKNNFRVKKVTNQC